MEEQVESMGATVAAVASIPAASALVPKSPLKIEEMSQSSPDNEASERSDGTASPPPNCSICLGKLINKSFTDSCLHQFCFSCLLQWSKIKTECPLCKQTFKSIIHNVRSEEDYDQYHVPRQFASLPAPQMAATLDVNFDLVGLNLNVAGRGFSYRTTMTPNRRYGVFLNPDQVARREQVPALTSLVSTEERRLRRTNPVDYRRNVYRFGIWATSLPDIFGNFRDCSADYYRREPNQLNRLIPWLNRELQVLLNNNAPHVAYVLRIIMESLTRFDLRSPEFRDVVRPYFGIHTEHFVHELLNYARTSFDLIGYDQYVTYVPGHGFSNEYVPLVTSPSSSGSSTSNDSDVQVVDETIDASRLNNEMPRVGPHTVEMPGPSTVAEAFHEQIPSSRIVLTISSSSSGASDNECEVVGYVKPRHERTPEIIDILSSDAETTNVTNAAPLDYGDHTRHNYQSATRQYTTYEDSVDRSLLDSPSVPTSGEVYEPGTSTDRKRSSTRNNIRMTMKSRLSDSTSSESDDFDSDRDYSPRGSGKSKSKLKRSTGASVRQQKRKRGSSMLARIRRRVKVMISSSSESDEKSKRRGYEPASPGSDKRRYSSSWSDSSPERRSKRQKPEGKSKSVQPEPANTIKVRKDLIKREGWYGYECAESDGSQVSASVSERKSSSSKKCEVKTYRTNKDSESEKEARRQNSEDDESQNKKHTDSKYKSEYSTTDSERTLSNVRSSSQCSVRSSKAHVSKKKSKHKDKRREKRSHRSSNSKSVVSAATDSFQADDCAPGVSTASITSSARSETLLPSKYSNSKRRPSSKERRRSHKKHKESKKSRKRSKSESKSRSKKKKRRIKSSSSSDSERDTASKLC